MILARRQFMQTGIAGSALLALAGWLNQPFAAVLTGQPAPVTL